MFLKENSEQFVDQVCVKAKTKKTSRATLLILTPNKITDFVFSSAFPVMLDLPFDE